MKVSLFSLKISVLCVVGYFGIIKANDMEYAEAFDCETCLTKGENSSDIIVRPVPWLTESAIAFLEEYLAQNQHAHILEFGSGASTLWFAKRTQNLISVEHNRKWFNAVKSVLESNLEGFPVNYNYRSLPYASFCDRFPKNYFDLILVDGRNRKACILKAIRVLKPGGVLMLDNAERRYYHGVFSLLAKWPTVITEQKRPDSCGFWYKGWRTQWWIKPVGNA